MGLCGSGVEMKMVAACIVVVAAVALMSGGVCSAETRIECLNKCVGRCVDARVGLCSINCAVGCHWPFSGPTTGEMLVSSQEPEENAAAPAMQAASAPAAEPAADQGN